MNRKICFFVYAGAGILGVFIFIIVVIALIPDDFAEGILRRQLEQNASLSFKAEVFKKTFPVGLEADRASVFPLTGGKEIMYFDRVNVKLNLLYLLLARLKLDVHGSIDGGEMSAVVTIKRGGVDIDTEVKKMPVSSVPALKAAGLRGSGTLSGSSVFTLPKNAGCPYGSVYLAGSGVDLNGINFPAVLLLLKDKADITLSLDAKDCRAVLKSLWVDGQMVKLKLFGEVAPEKNLPDSRIDLTLEVLPKSDLPILALFSQYRKSSTFYSMRLKGELRSPAVTP